MRERFLTVCIGVYMRDEEKKTLSVCIYMDSGSGGATWSITKLPSMLYTGNDRKRKYGNDSLALHSKHCGGASLFT